MLVTIRIGGRLEDRRLDAARAGAWSREQASRRLDAFIRANALALAVVLVGTAVLSAVLWLVLSPWDGAREFIVGAFAATCVASTYHWCVLASGSVNATMGATAEQWTSTELWRLRRHGWRTINRLVFRKGDIDHIAVGPEGVIVVETKWRSAKLAVEDHDQWLAAAAKQVKRNERDVAGHLGWGARKDARITSLIVVWGPRVEQQGDEAPRIGGDVNVVAGDHLRDELAHLSEAHLTPDEVDAIYAKLKKWVEQKDRWTAERAEPERRTLAQLATSWMQLTMVGLAGAFIALLAFRPSWWYFGVALALLVIGLVARRRERTADLATAWLVGTQIVTLVAVIIAAWSTFD